MCREFGVLFAFRIYDVLAHQGAWSVESSASTFQIRPHREFDASRGREKLLSLPMLYEQHNSSDVNEGEEPRNAYDFMRKRQLETGGDPTVRKQHALIRLSNYGSDNAPLCVRLKYLFDSECTH